MDYTVVIPARYASTRLPGKPLIPILGKPLLQYVYQQAQATGANDIIIATDDERIETVAKNFGANVCLTSRDHLSGSERLAEVVEKMNYDDEHIIVNLQGDEPLMPSVTIEQVATNLHNNDAINAATLATPINSAEELFNPNVVKVITDKQGLAIYFSRAVIPWDRNHFSTTTDSLPSNSSYLRHIGIYAYRAGFIQDYVQCSRCHLEQAEALEQLRILYYGHKIHVAMAVEQPGPGVDTQEDIEQVEKIIREA